MDPHGDAQRIRELAAALQGRQLGPDREDAEELCRHDRLLLARAAGLMENDATGLPLPQERLLSLAGRWSTGHNDRTLLAVELWTGGRRDDV